MTPEREARIRAELAADEWRGNTVSQTMLDLYDAMAALDAERAAHERDMLPFLISCPWCASDQRDVSLVNQIRHLIECGDRERAAHAATRAERDTAEQWYHDALAEIDRAASEIHRLRAVRDAALAVSTDLAQDCLEDPVGWHQREQAKWRRLSVAPSDALAAALRALAAAPAWSPAMGPLARLTALLADRERMGRLLWQAWITRHGGDGSEESWHSVTPANVEGWKQDAERFAVLLRAALDGEGA